jgi:hypothetical protein
MKLLKYFSAKTLAGMVADMEYSSASGDEIDLVLKWGNDFVGEERFADYLFLARLEYGRDAAEKDSNGYEIETGLRKVCGECKRPV